MFDQVITTALLYANGPLHLGHLVEHIQADTYVRSQRMQRQKCLFVGGSDAHGTPIMLSSQQQNLTAEQLVSKIHAEHRSDLENFSIFYDQFSTTHDKENQTLTEACFNALYEKGLITTREINQPYDAVAKMFLPDRYITGQCPKCHAEKQYGDNCEACGATYAAHDLIQPISTLSKTTPITKTSRHYFFKLSDCQTFLDQWLNRLETHPSVIKKLREWFKDGLKDWDISRDEPYFGFKIPGEDHKYFYVWLDAPIGYMAACLQYCSRKKLSFDDIWHTNATTKLKHFIGKDITYFHALFWPAILHGANYRLPNAIYTHGFLTINGTKMSKSRNTFITAKTYLDYFEPDLLRYFFCCKLSDHVEDIDLNWQEFKSRIDTELVGKVINIASRSAKLLSKHFDNTLLKIDTQQDLYQMCLRTSETTQAFMNNRQFNQATREIISCADQINQYLADQAPWALVKELATMTSAHEVCSHAIQCFRCLITLLKPITPNICQRAEQFINHSDHHFDDILTPLPAGHKLNPYEHLLQRISPESLNQLVG